MNKMTRLSRLAVATAAAALTLTAAPGLAGADPAPAPAPPAAPGAPAGSVAGDGSAVRSPSRATAPTDAAYAVIDTSALPLNSTAKWAPVTGHDTTSGVLRGITRCSVDGHPAPADLDARAKATSPTYTAWLRPTGDTQGWGGSVSAATYPNVAAASYALDAYRRYLDACATAPADAEQFHNAAEGTSALDPTQAHALIETSDVWVEVFAVATNDALVETVFTHPKGGPVSFAYNPAAVFGALKMADVGALARPVA